jgi:hypothetical protein
MTIDELEETHGIDNVNIEVFNDTQARLFSLREFKRFKQPVIDAVDKAFGEGYVGKVGFKALIKE